MPTKLEFYVEIYEYALICNAAENSTPTDTAAALGNFNLSQIIWCYSDNFGRIVSASTSDRATFFSNNYFIAIYFNITVLLTVMADC